MNIGDTYTAEKIIFNQLTNPTGTEQDDKQIDLLEALAFEHMDTRLASISAAQGDTCRWLFDTQEYRRWRRGFRRSRRRFLWIKGKPGAGKSTMMCLAFHEAAKDFRKSIVAGYFFNARGHSMAKSTQGMYRSLLHQIFSKLAQLPPEIPSSVTASLKEQGWSIPVLQDMLRTVVLHLGHDQSLVCYIDALDECAEDDIREAIHHFEELASLALTRDTKFLICFASRHYPTITIRHHRAIDLDKQTGHHQDISDYVSSALRVSGSLGDELQRSLLDRSAGVFLWAVLSVRMLNKIHDQGGTREQLRARLREVPTGVQSLFSEILQEGDVYLLPTLQWVLFADRPLFVSELYCAIMASVKIQPAGIWDENEIDIEGMRRFILASSKGLVECSNSSNRYTGNSEGFPVVYESKTQLIRESLREYLLQDGLVRLDPSLRNNTDAIIHARLAEACQAYVSNVQHRHEPGSYFPHRYPFLEYVTSATVHHLDVAFTSHVLPRRVLGEFAHLWLTSRMIIKQPSSLGRGQSANLLCLSLAKSVDQISADDRKLMCDTLRPDERSKTKTEINLEPSPLHVFRRWHSEERKKYLLLFQAAIGAGSVDVLQLYRRQGRKELFDLLLPDVLINASVLGLTSVLSLLLECVSDCEKSHQFWEEMLKGAAVNLQEGTTQFLLQRGAKPNAATIEALAPSSEWTRPTDGSEEKRLRIMAALLDAGADVTRVRFDHCIVKRKRILALLKERGASIKHCEFLASDSQLGVCTLTCRHGYSRACPEQGKQM
jgi:hypothetical protein